MLPRYFRTIDELYNDPKKPLNDIYLVATEPDAGQQTRAVAQFARAGIRTTGYSRVVSSKVTAVNLTNQPQAKPRVVPTVKVTTCVDVSAVTAVDKLGKSAVPRGRKQFLISQLTVINYKYPSATSWVVSDAPNQEASSCGA